MIELIEQVLEKNFSEYKENQIWILIVFTILIAVIQIIQAYFVTTKIEKFKNDLKKSEIKFSRYNELQINALRKIYHQLASFQLANNLIFNSEPNSIHHSKFKIRINDWIKIYVECSSEFAREKILLTKEIKILFSKTISDFEEVKKVLIDQRHNLDYFEMEHQGNWNSMYEFEEEELNSITQQINKLKEKYFIQNADKHIRELREKIEETFQQME